MFKFDFISLFRNFFCLAQLIFFYFSISILRMDEKTVWYQKETKIMDKTSSSKKLKKNRMQQTK